jgi:PKD domain
MADNHWLRPDSTTATSTGARIGRRLGLVALLAGLLATVGWSWAPHSTLVVTPASTTQTKVHFFPSIPYEKAHPTVCTTDCTLMTFHGGTVQHAELDYFIFWAPAGFYMPSSYRSGLSTWLSEVAAADYTPGNQFSVAQQYYDNTGPGATKNFVPYAVANGGGIIDTDALPASGCTDSGTTVCINDSQIRTEIQKVITAHKLPQNENTQYILFTPLKVGSCFTSASTSCAYTQYCGYHSFFTGTLGQIVYANMPWSYSVSGCDVNLAFSTGYPNGSAIDPEVGVLSHELIETMTDANLNAWFDSSGNEIGDKCAYIYGSGGYGSMTGLANNGLGYWNTPLSGDEYLLQLEFSNRNSNGTSTGCVRTDTDTQPSFTITISPNPPVHGSSATFTANVTDPYGINRVYWIFGDGTSTIVYATNTVKHTYATAGTKTLTVIVTDNHGNEKRVIETITVS